MKNPLFILALVLCSMLYAPCSAYAQTIPPPYINYQAVLYDVNSATPNAVLANQSFQTFVNIQDQLGNLLYKEEHFASTDANGLITVKMGDGVYTAGTITNFNQINWSVGKYYLVVDFNINGTISSTAPEQLVTVPYSFYSGNAGNGMTGVSDNGNGTLTFTYANGSTYTTPTLSGIQGPTGATGPQGPAGAQGANGQSAYELWLVQGNTGSQQDFLNSLNGSVGPQGPAGPTGLTGSNGQSAYETWLSLGNSGSEQDFINSLVAQSGGTQELIVTSANGSNLTTYTVQPYLSNYGTGVNGSYISSNGGNLSTGQYTNFTIQFGHTVNLPLGTTTIMVKDTCRIIGNINGKGNDMGCGGCNTCVGYTQNGAGGGGGATPVCYNNCSSCYHHGPYGQSLSWNVYGSLETNLNPLSYSYTIAPAQSITSSQLLTALQIRPFLHGGNGGWRCTGEFSSGCGGKGIYIICRVLIFEGSIDLRGGNGKASTNDSCRDGAGGGGGGSAVISSKEIITNTGNFLNNGGTGGTAYNSLGCSGQNGGAGTYVIIDMP